MKIHFTYPEFRFYMDRVNGIHSRLFFHQFKGYWSHKYSAFPIIWQK